MESKVNELLQKRAVLVEQSRAITSKAVETEKRALGAEETVQVDKIFEEIRTLDKTIETVKQQRELERSAAEFDVEKRENSALKNDSKDDANKAWRSYLASGHVGNGRGADELRAMQADLQTDGGFLIAPQQFVSQLIKSVDDLLFFRQKATVWPLTGAESLGVPTRTARSSSASWTGEITTVGDDSSLKFGKRELKPKPLSLELLVSKPLLRVSALPVEQIVMDELAYAVAVPQEQAYMTGTGAGQPLGIFTASNDGVPTTQDVATDNTTTAITADGLLNAKYKLKSQYQKTAEWYFHRDAVKMISKLKDGEGRYLWQPSIQMGQPDMLLGRPLNQSEYAPNTFTTGLYVGMFADLKNYWIAESQVLEMQRLDELYAKTNQVGFIVRAAVDGQPVLAEAFARVQLA